MTRGTAPWPRHGRAGAARRRCAGYIVARALTPGDSVVPFRAAKPCCSRARIEQCRLVYRQALTFLEPRIDEYRMVDSRDPRGDHTRKDEPDAAQSGGLESEDFARVWSGVPIAIIDEPAALSHRSAGRRYGMRSGRRKASRAAPLKAILTGTLAPSDPGSWWPVLVENGTVRVDVGRTATGPRRSVVALARDPSRQPARPTLPRNGRSAARGTRRGDGGQSAGRGVQELTVEPAGGRRIHDVAERRGLGAGDGAAGSRARGPADRRDRSRRRPGMERDSGSLALGSGRGARGGAGHPELGGARKARPATVGNLPPAGAPWCAARPPMVCGCNRPAELWRAVVAAWGKSCAGDLRSVPAPRAGGRHRARASRSSRG